MNITTGQFNDSFMPIMDGVAITTKNYAYWLNKKYGKSIVVTPSFPDYIDEEEFSVIRYKSIGLPKRPPYRLGLPNFDSTLKGKLNDNDFNIVHAHSPFSSGKVALKLARERNIPIVATFHSKFYDDFKEALKLDVLAKYSVSRVINFFNKVDKVYTVNASTVETLRGYGFKGNVEIIENGTDFNLIADFSSYREYINNKYKLTKDTKVLLFVGQHIWQKNVKLIIDSLAILKKQKLKFKMFFIGDGYAREEMIKLVNNLQLDEDVIFVGQLNDRELLKKYYARADLFLFPSLYDTVGLVVKEAASFKVPSLVIRNSNAQEIIKNNFNGYVTDNESYSFSFKIIAILNDKNKNIVGLNAQQTLVKSYESVVDEVYQRYLEIIKLKKQY